MTLAYNIPLIKMALLCVNLLVEIDLSAYTTEEEERDCLSQQNPYIIYLSSPTGIVADHKTKYILNRDKEALFVPLTLNLLCY